MKNRAGFSLLEISIVIFIMGLTITALLQMFDWSHARYRQISRSWQERACLSEIRIWLRNSIMRAEPASINLKNLREAVKIPDGFLIDQLQLIAHDELTCFVRIGFADDLNRNGKTDAGEGSTRLFCFRRRSA
jgi:prepilin-type N-terminal cleavage/methylation domain-containing protein